MRLDCGGRWLELSSPVVMGVLNVTPDSFSDGGKYLGRDVALERARTMVDQGAGLIDVGGESTRPGAQPVGVNEEIDRVVPLVEALSRDLSVPISVDTSKSEVMRAAAGAGAGMINDVRALREPGALEAAAETGLPICLMHMQGEPRSMQEKPLYDDVLEDIADFFEQRIQACSAAGIVPDRLILDPGFGFGKTLEHNLTLLAGLDRFHRFQRPLLVGLSRKSMFGHLLQAPVDRRQAASVAGAVLAMQRGAHIIRVHDVEETVHAARLFDAVSSRIGLV